MNLNKTKWRSHERSSNASKAQESRLQPHAEKAEHPAQKGGSSDQKSGIFYNLNSCQNLYNDDLSRSKKAETMVVKIKTATKMKKKPEPKRTQTETIEVGKNISPYSVFCALS